ncbi:hypothetical protein LNQ03_09225 [Klebsiella pneumoniae subsp. pneumoniae]|nr:hypothetical protein [Klebsiella pneumoniae subsp. pneumoniae]
MQAAKVTDNPNQISKAGDLAGENYDLQKAEEARQEAQRKENSKINVQPQPQNRYHKNLNSFGRKPCSQLILLKNYRENSPYSRSAVSGKGATQEQIALAGKYAAQA